MIDPAIDAIVINRKYSKVIDLTMENVLHPFTFLMAISFVRCSAVKGLFFSIGLLELPNPIHNLSTLDNASFDQTLSYGTEYWKLYIKVRCDKLDSSQHHHYCPVYPLFDQ